MNYDTSAVRPDRAYMPGNILKGIIFAAFIICFAVSFTLYCRPLYYYDIGYLQIAERSGMDADTIRKNYDVLIDYNLFWHDEELEFPDFVMSESGKIHFEESKAIFVFFQYGLIVTLVLSAAIICVQACRRRFAFLKTAGLIAIGLPAVLGILLAWNWEWFFVTFHHIAFDNEYWIFDEATDPVITILPDTFFMHCAVMIILIVILLGIVSIAAGCIAGRHRGE